MTNKSVSEIIDVDYRDFSMHVVESRAIPSMIDGFKPSLRKAIYSALKVAKNAPIKTMGLIGEVLSNGYQHGDASMSGVIQLMTADWANNIPLLEGEGSFGNRFVHAGAAPRYTKVKLNKKFFDVFKDFDILEANLDPEIVEPKYYLPLIPWVLVNGISGIAVGFATEIQPRNPKNLVDACILAARHNHIDERLTTPYLGYFKGKIKKHENGVHYQEGVIKEEGANKIRVLEIPTGWQRANYVAHLDKLVELGKIGSYVDQCDKKGFNFLLNFKRGTVLPSKDKLLKMLGLYENMNENLNVIDEHGKLRHYDHVVELIKDFVTFRIGKVKDRYIAWKKRDLIEIERLNARLKFIGQVVNQKIKFVGMNKDALKAWFTSESYKEEYISWLMATPTYMFCSDEIESLKKQIKKLEDDVKIWEKKIQHPDLAYIDDLEELKGKL